MHILSVSLIVAVAATTISVPGLTAQSATPPSAKLIGSCSSGLSGGGRDCRLDHRLLIDLRRQGPGAPPELDEVVSMGALIAEAFRLTPEQATAADSTVYAILDVKRDAGGEYTIVESIGGSSATRPRNCDARSTGRLNDLAFGAFLAASTSQLVRCTRQSRPQVGTIR